MKVNFQPLSWIILAIGLSLYVVECAMNNNFINSSLILMMTLLIWTCLHIFTKSFKMHSFSWVVSISGYILAISVLFHFGIIQNAFSKDSVNFNIAGVAVALAVSLISSLPILLLNYKSDIQSRIQTVEQPQATDDSSNSDDDNWEHATEDDLYSGEYELDS